jgi:ABC-type bacteriocin/lantibiotic exporter with double-glycine peptidase domain
MESSFMGKVSDVFPAFKRTITINEWKWFTAQMLIAIIYAVIVIGYVYQHYVPGETFYMGGLITLLGYVSQFTSVFNDIAAQYTQITQYNTDVQTARNISEAYEKEHRPEAASTLPEDWQSLSISNLNFTRQETIPGQKRFAGLRDLHMRIQRGQRIALIGESGCGKSTLLSLLRGLYVPGEGVCVEVDGDIPSDFESIANTVTLLPQEPEIFENTLRYNITLGLPFSEEEVMQVCEVAQFTEVIRQLPNGLDTVIQEKGANFSGGQRQRLALARGILAARSSSIVLMDEPTSSVDPRTEVQLYNKLFKAFTGKAVISSLHRLHLLTQFDYIYILSTGRVIEEGTFETLRYNSEVFREMWRHQQEEYTEKSIPAPAGP